MNLTKSKYGWYGSAIGFLALTIAVLSPWIISLNSPPPKPLDEVIVETAKRMKHEVEHGSEDSSLSAREHDHARWVETVVIVSAIMALAAVGLGLISLRTREDKLASGGAIALGGTALAVQFLWVVLLIALGVFVVVAAYKLIESGGI